MPRRVLYVTHRVPWPPDRGDRIRTWNILKFLAARAEVDLLCLADEPASPECLSVLKRMTNRLAVVPHQGFHRYCSGLLSMICGGTITEGMFECRKAVDILKTWSASGGWDAALASSSGVAEYTSPEILGTRVRRWIDLIDVDSQKWHDYSRSAAWPKSWIYWLEGRRLRNVEKRLAQDCERLLVVSEAESRLFRQFCPTDHIKAVGNGVDTEYFSPGPPPAQSEKSCVFVGVMNYLPNVDAVSWFAKEVWPQVRQRHPEAIFRIVGKAPSLEVRRLASIEGIEVTGPVPDVRPWLYRASCAVTPLRIARGIQNKVLEAMACGRPVISSSAPLAGLSAEPGLHLLQADTPAEWVAAVCRVFEDRGLQQELGLAASAWVRMHHCWDACLEPFSDLLSAPVSQMISETEITA